MAIKKLFIAATLCASMAAGSVTAGAAVIPTPSGDNKGEVIIVVGLIALATMFFLGKRSDGTTTYSTSGSSPDAQTAKPKGKLIQGF